MRVIEFEQGTEEWLNARLGIPTASNFSKILTASGKRSAQLEGYVNQLVSEKLTSEPAFKFTSDAIERGIELEPHARLSYIHETGRNVDLIGLCLLDDIDAGASPDGLVEDGLIEIKCPLGHTMIDYLDNPGLPGNYKPQVQGQLWVTGREWCDFYAWHPDMISMLIRVERDEEYISLLEELVEEVVNSVNVKYEKYRRK